MPKRPSELNPRQTLQLRIGHLKCNDAYASLASVFEHIEPNVQDEAVLAQLLQLVYLFPKADSDAFWFDVMLMQQITNDWRSQNLPLSPNIIPVYQQGWSYTLGRVEVLATALANLGQDPALHFITFNRSEEAITPYLLDYSWLHHELAHHAMRLVENPFISAFTEVREAFLLQFELAHLSFRNRARSSADETLQALTIYWELIADHKNWACEIAMDVIALYTCGPVYLTAFVADTSNTADAFSIIKSHPPPFYRVKALIRTAESIGWASHTKGLTDLLLRFEGGSTSAALANVAASYAPNELVQGVIEAALKYCEALPLPRFTHERLDKIRSALAKDELLQGTDLIVAAWLVEVDSPDAYNAWEQRTFQRFIEAYTK